MKIKELWHTSPSSTEIMLNEAPVVKKGEVLIASLFSLISTGTERLVAKKMVPELLWDTMKVPYMGGSFSLPCKYGYSLVGKVINGPSALMDKTVHVMHPHQDYAVIKEKDIKVIDNLFPAKRGILISNMETIINAIWDSEVTTGDYVLITGFGLIGALLAHTLRKLPGIKIIIAEINEKRIDILQKLGFELFNPSKQLSFDCTFNTTSNQNGLQLCIDNAGFEGTITDLSWYGNEKISVRLGESFHSMRKRIISSQVSSIPARKVNRWNIERRKNLAIELLKDETIDELIKNETPFSQIPKIFNSIREATLNDIACVIKY